MVPGIHCYLDRFEGDLAVLLVDDVEKSISVSILPPDAREGDHLLITIVIDPGERNRVAEEVTHIQQDLKNEGDAT